MRKHIYVLPLTTLFALASCSPTPPEPRYPLAVDSIHQALANGVIGNQQLSTNSKVQAPTAVNNALLGSTGNALPIPDNGYQRRFNVSVNNVPAQAFFMGLAQGTPYNMVVDPNVTGNITLQLQNVTIEEALQAASDSYGYQYHRTNYGYEVLPAAMQTQVFTVNYLNIARQGDTQTNLTSGEIVNSVGTGGSSTSSSSTINGQTINQSGVLTSIDTRTQDDFWDSLSATLKTMVPNTDGRSVLVNPQASLVVVHAYPAELKMVGEYLDSLENNINREVILEAEILEVQLNDQYQAGIDFSMFGFNQTLGPSSALFTAAAVNNLTISGGSFKAVISALEQQGNVQVLSSPRVSTLNNQQAAIKVGSDQFFVTGVTQNLVPSTTGSTATTSSVILTPFFAGITLNVTPQISSNGMITLEIHPTVSQTQQQITNINLGTQGELQLPLALSQIRESDDVVRAQDGQVIVIGGLMSNNTTENVSSTPWASKIPFAGALFRNTNQSSTKQELVILLRPVIVDNGSGAWNRDMKQTDNQYGQWQRGFHYGSRTPVFGNEAEFDNP